MTTHENDSPLENPDINSIMNTHSCCDTCRDECKCSECPECPLAMSTCALDDDSELHEKPDNVRALHDESLVVFKENLVDYWNQLIEEADYRLEDDVQMIHLDSVSIDQVWVSAYCRRQIDTY